MIEKLQPYWKTVVAVLTVAATVLTAVQPFITDEKIKQYVIIVLVVLGALGVYAVRNEPPGLPPKA